MVYESNSYSSPEQSVMWDLRQFYVEWVRGYMANFSRAHLTDDYPGMFRALKQWHTVIWGRAIKKYEEKKIKDEKFEKLMDNLVTLINKKEYQRTYLMQERNADAVSRFDDAFDSLVVYIIWLMKDNKLFGSDSINRGLA